MYRILSVYLLALFLIGCTSSKREPSVAQQRQLETIAIELTTQMGGQQQFVEGDELQFLLSLGQDAFIYMYHIDAEKKITQLLPSPEQSSHFYKAGYFLTIPEYKDLYRFRVKEPFGEESIWVFASDESMVTEPLRSNIDQIRRDIKLSSGKAFGEYELSISTQKKSRF
jgi:Domain of unknown function (DUF4384)